MPFNGVGVAAVAGANAVTSTPISSAEYNAMRADLNGMLTNCVTRDGQSPATQNLPMAGFRHTGVGNAQTADQYAALGQVQGIVPGFVNMLDNAGAFLNQRGYVPGTPVGAANTYTIDRWRVVTSGQSLTWSDSAGVRTLTAPAGGLEQVIEGVRIAAGDYVLTWTGTASATVNGSPVANGAVVTLSGGANVTVRFSGGTVAQPQLQRGRVATPFEWRHPSVELLLCQRYHLLLENVLLLRYGSFAVFAGGATTLVFPARMRVAPTVTRSFGAGDFDDPVFSVTPTGCVVSFASGSTIGNFALYTLRFNSEF